MPGHIFILIQIEHRSHGFHRFIKSNLLHLLNLRENPFACSFALHEKTNVLKKILHKNFCDFTSFIGPFLKESVNLRFVVKKKTDFSISLSQYFIENYLFLFGG